MSNSFEKFSYKFIRYGMLFTVFIPLIIFRSTFSPANFTKVIVFRTLIEAMLPFYVYLAIKNPQFRPWYGIGSMFGSSTSKHAAKHWVGVFFDNSRLAIFFALTLFVVSYAISTFVGVSPHISMWGSWERMGGLFSFLHYYVLFVLFISIFRTAKDWLVFLNLSVLASLFAVGFGFLQKLNLTSIWGADERFRIFSTFGNAAQFGGYLIFNIYFALFLFFYSAQSRWQKFFYLAVVGVELTALFMTAVKGSALAVILTLPILVLVALSAEIKRYWRKIALALVLLATGFLVFFNNLQSAKYLSPYFNFSLKSRTTNARLIAWSEGIEGIREKPWFGWGPENFSVIFGKFYRPEIYRGIASEHIFDRAHNVWIEIASTQGLVGLTVFAFLWVVTFRAVGQQTLLRSLLRFDLNRDLNKDGPNRGGVVAVSRVAKLIRLTLTLLFIAYLIHNTFIFDLVSSYIMWMALLGLIIFLTESEPVKVTPVQPVQKAILPKSKNALVVAKTITTAVAVLVSWFAWQTNVKSMLSNIYTARGYFHFKSNKYKKGLEYFQKAVANAKWQSQDVRRKFTEGYIDMIFDFNLPKQISREELGSNLKFLDEEFDAEIGDNPGEFAGYVYGAKINQARARFVDGGTSFKRAEELLLEAIKHNPNMPNLYQDIAYLYYLKEDWEKTLVNSRHAFKLAPHYPETKFQLGQYLIYYGDGDNRGLKDESEEGIRLALEAIEEAYSKPPDIKWLSSYLERSKRYDEMIRLYNWLSRDNYGDPNFLVQLSGAYWLKGNKEKSFEAADRALTNIQKLTKGNAEFLANIFKWLGDNKKRTEVILKSRVFGPETIQKSN